jgi:hypothetical protein
LDLDNMDKHGEKHGKNHETSESMACCFTCLHYAIWKIPLTLNNIMRCQ